MLSYYLMFSFQQNWRRGQNRFCLEARGLGGGKGGSEGHVGEMAQTMYAHINKWIKQTNKQTKNQKEKQGGRRDPAWAVGTSGKGEDVGRWCEGEYGANIVYTCM
jgi:hypothetical protein